jgi:hypothetical protein
MNGKLLVLIGAVATIAGLFLPVADTINPADGTAMSINFLLPGGSLGDGIVTLALAVIAAVLALINQTRHAVWPAIIGLGYLAWRFIEIKGATDQATSLLAMMAPEQAQNYHIGINILGWAVIVLGTVITLVGGAMAWKGAAASPPPAA